MKCDMCKGPAEFRVITEFNGASYVCGFHLERSMSYGASGRFRVERLSNDPKPAPNLEDIDRRLEIMEAKDSEHWAIIMEAKRNLDDVLQFRKEHMQEYGKERAVLNQLTDLCAGIEGVLDEVARRVVELESTVNSKDEEIPKGKPMPDPEAAAKYYVAETEPDGYVAIGPTSYPGWTKESMIKAFIAGAAWRRKEDK